MFVSKTLLREYQEGEKSGLLGYDGSRESKWESDGEVLWRALKKFGIEGRLFDRYYEFPLTQ